MLYKLRSPVHHNHYYLRFFEPLLIKVGVNIYYKTLDGMGFTTLPFSQDSYQWVMLGILLMILTLVVDENVSLHNEASKGMLLASHEIQLSL